MPEVMSVSGRKRRNGGELVSASALAVHLSCTRQYIAKLTAEGVIERRGGGYDQDGCRLRYLAHLRSENRRSPRTAADAEYALAKAALLRLRVQEKRRQLVPLEDAVGHMDEVVGLFLSRLSGFAARCGGRDLATRRAIEQAVYDLRREISEACTKMADARGEPLLEEQI